MRPPQDTPRGGHGRTPPSALYLWRGEQHAGPYPGEVIGERILVVEDDLTIGRALAATLESEGHDVGWVETATDALRDAVARPPALVLLDLGLPDRDGIEVCRELRALAPRCRIVILTARADEVDAVVGLDAGADDYVTKPFRLGELLARVRAHLRRNDELGESDLIEVGDLVLDAQARRVSVDGNDVELRPKEFDLLLLLMREAGRAVTRERIMEQVWDEHWFGSTKTLDMHILALRRKLEHTSAKITTLRHVGYRLDS
jgi:DNA-binding response OmpR family regulator